MRNSYVEEIVVHGKIPRNSIAIPTITGERYSPDFMYVVKKASGVKELNIVVETKASSKHYRRMATRYISAINSITGR